MRKGDLVMPLDENAHWEIPGIIIKGPYGAIEPTKARYDGKLVASIETKVVDVLLDQQVFTKIPIEKLKVLK